MHRGLIWHGTGAFKVSTTYRAPTWSWASIDGPIYATKLGDATRSSAAQVKGVVTIPTHQRCDWAADWWHLRLSGTLLKVELGNLPDTVIQILRLKAELEVPLGNLSPDAEKLIFYPTEPRMHGDLIISPSIEDLRTEKEIFFMPLLYHQNDNPDSSMSVGLALCPENGVDGC